MEPRKHYFAKIPTIAIFIVMAMSGPLGVLLFILKGIDQKVQKEEQEAAAARGDYRADLGPEPDRKSEPVYGHDVPTEEQKSAKKWHKTIATLCTIMGAVFLFSGLTDAVDVISVWKFWPDPGELFSNIAMAIGGGGALLTGLRMNHTHKLERLLDKVVGERDNIPLPELFAAAGVDAARGRTAVKSAIEHGYFGADAYIDNRTDTLVVRGVAPQPKKPMQTPARRRGRVRCPAAPAAGGERCHSRPGDEREDLPAGRGQRAYFCAGAEGPGEKGAAAKVYELLSAHCAQAAEHLRQPFPAGSGGHEHHRSQTQHRAQHGPAGDRL